MIFKQLIPNDFKRNAIEAFWSSLKESFLHLAYPAKCVHCSMSLPPASPYLCDSCGMLLERLNSQEHCRFCFCHLGGEEGSVCEECFQYPSSYMYRAAVFPYEGVAATLVRRLKYGSRPYLAKGMAAYLYLQWDSLGWPVPDALIPTPLSFLRKLERGYNQSELLAEELGKFLRCPIWNALKRRGGDYPQAALNFEQRQQLGGECFQLKSGYSLMHKNVLVIDDVITSGSTLERCAEALSVDSPCNLYALTFCKTLKTY